MTKIPSTPQDDGTTSDPSLIVYPVDRLRQAAAQLLVSADNALQQHNQTWSQIQQWLHDNDDKGYMASVLNPHEKRMRDSYNWQMQLASTLFDAIDQINNNEDNTAQDFHRGPGKPF